MKHEFTLTLRPLLYSKTPQQQFDITSSLIKQVLSRYKYTLIAELTQEHNVHYHGLVDIEGIVAKDAFLNCFRSLNKYLGRKSCTGVQYESSYEKYMVKDIDKTFKVITDPVVKDDYKIYIKPFDLFKSSNGACVAVTETEKDRKMEMKSFAGDQKGKFGAIARRSEGTKQTNNPTDRDYLASPVGSPEGTEVNNSLYKWLDKCDPFSVINCCK